MNLRLMVFIALGAVLPMPAGGQTRTLKICVDANAAPEIREAAARVSKGVGQSPLLSVLGAHGVTLVDSGKLVAEPVEARAMHHLILVGMPTDPMIQLAWQHEAMVEEGGLYVFGFGHLHGTLGYVESDRNVFLHSAGIKAAPYETETITLTGTSPAGVSLAVDAFLSGGLVNGVVAAPGWTRSRPGLLDRDPLTASPVWPALAPVSLGSGAGAALRVGETQAGESEYRDVLAATGSMPVSIWRVKYYVPGAWDGAAPHELSSPGAYLDGLHRRAYGNTLWLASFGSDADAAQAAHKLADAAHMQAQPDGRWLGSQPVGDAAGEPKDSTRPHALRLWVAGSTVLMSTVAQAGK